MEDTKIDTFRQHHKILDREASYYSRHLGIVMGLLENDDIPRVLNQSKNGHYLHTGSIEIINALILFVCRSWDKGRDTCSIEKLIKSLPTLAHLEEYHAARARELKMDPQLDWIPYCRQNFIDLSRAARRADLAGVWGLRNQVLAHTIPSEEKLDLPTYNELVSIAEQTMNLIGKAGYLIEMLANPYPDRIKNARISCSEFWAIMPPLTVLEKERWSSLGE